jgi:predicted metalloprotease with PDZ domain
MPREMPRLGAVVQWESAPGAEGFRVLHVLEESPASEAGIESGDVVVAVDGHGLAWPEARRLLAPDWSSRHVPILALHRGDAVELVAPPVRGEE